MKDNLKQKKESSNQQIQKPVCKYCKKPGHTIDDCWTLQAKNTLFSSFSQKLTNIMESVWAEQEVIKKLKIIIEYLLFKTDLIDFDHIPSLLAIISLCFYP